MHSGNDRMWEYGQDQSDWGDSRLVGYKIEALDGDIGKVDDATTETGSQSVVVDTGPWIFGQKVMLPAGLIDRVDHDEEKVFVSATKDQIKQAPQYDDSMRDNTTYRESLGGYYGGIR